MSNIIEKSQSEINDEELSHKREDEIIDQALEKIKSNIEISKKKNLNEYWWIEGAEWVFDGYLNTTFSSLDENGEGFWKELEKYKTNDIEAQIEYNYYTDFNYIKTELDKKLKDLGCKEVYSLIGLVDVDIEMILVGKNVLGIKKAETHVSDIPILKWAIRVTW